MYKFISYPVSESYYFQGAFYWECGCENEVEVGQNFFQHVFRSVVLQDGDIHGWQMSQVPVKFVFIVEMFVLSSSL